MERWKWRMDDLRNGGGLGWVVGGGGRGEGGGRERRKEGRREGDEWNGCGCYSILTDQSGGGGGICILSTL